MVSLYTSDTSVQAIAISLLLMAAVFQIADGAQIGAAGALRGYKDTKMPMVINMFAYWALGFPLAYLATITYRGATFLYMGGVRARINCRSDLVDVAVFENFEGTNRRGAI